MIEIVEINLDVLSEETGIAKDSVAELLSIYCSEMTEEMLQLETFYKIQDWSSLQKTVHNIKGVSANLYLQAMSEASACLDAKLKSLDYKELESNLQHLLMVFEKTEGSIEKALEQHKHNLENSR